MSTASSGTADLARDGGGDAATMVKGLSGQCKIPAGRRPAERGAGCNRGRNRYHRGFAPVNVTGAVGDHIMATQSSGKSAPPPPEVIEVDTASVGCDGGGGALGHPLI